MVIVINEHTRHSFNVVLIFVLSTYLHLFVGAVPINK